jgi:hypothetical protein
MLKHLAKVSPAIDLAAPIELKEAHVCLDTFIPGREAADCEFSTISARASLRPSH